VAAVTTFSALMPASTSTRRPSLTAGGLEATFTPDYQHRHFEGELAEHRFRFTCTFAEIAP
jgi:hypothetical protein